MNESDTVLCYDVSSCGNVLSYDKALPAAGELTSVTVTDAGRAEFHCSSEKLRVPDLIGRSLSIEQANGYVLKEKNYYGILCLFSVV